MKFTNDELIEIIRLSEQEDYSSRQIAAMYSCSKSTINYFLGKQTYPDFWEEHDKKPVASGDIISPLSKSKPIKEITNKTSFIITSAQNNTYVHDKFLKTLELCADYYDAEILISGFTYNKSGFQNSTKDSDDVWFDSKIRKYMYNESIQICDDLVFCAELNILPTAVNPLSGFSNYTNDSSSIIPHTKISLESVATAKYKETKMMYTTGTVTQSNYVMKKAGQKAASHHSYGAILVEVCEDGTWFARQLNAISEDGSFYDLDNHFSELGVSTDNRIQAINWGDIHVEKLDPVAGAVSFGITMDSEAELPYKVQGSNMLDDLKPKYSIFHDIIDFKVRNHHNRKNPLFKLQMLHEGTEQVRFGLQQCGTLLSLLEREDTEQVIVNSNHDAALKKWAVECDWKDDPVNAEFLLQCQLSLVRAVKRDPNYCLFEASVKGITTGINNVNFLRLDESFMVGGDNGIECGYHSHTGLSGARGTANSYKQAGLRYNIGHSHSGKILDGVYQAGVLGKMDMGYNVGLSSWSHSNIITYANNKRCIVTIKNGKYRKVRHE